MPSQSSSHCGTLGTNINKFHSSYQYFLTKNSYFSFSVEYLKYKISKTTLHTRVIFRRTVDSKTLPDQICKNKKPDTTATVMF